jgi:hypothetical protein
MNPTELNTYPFAVLDTHPVIFDFYGKGIDVDWLNILNDIKELSRDVVHEIIYFLNLNYVSIENFPNTYIFKALYDNQHLLIKDVEIKLQAITPKDIGFTGETVKFKVFLKEVLKCGFVPCPSITPFLYCLGSNSDMPDKDEEDYDNIKHRVFRFFTKPFDDKYFLDLNIRLNDALLKPQKIGLNEYIYSHFAHVFMIPDERDRLRFTRDQYWKNVFPKTKFSIPISLDDVLASIKESKT